MRFKKGGCLDGKAGGLVGLLSKTTLIRNTGQFGLSMLDMSTMKVLNKETRHKRCSWFMAAIKIV